MDERSDPPIPARPHMPGYDMMFRANSTAIPWSWAEERLRASHNYWLATTRPDGRAHVMPVWGIWFEGAFWFSTGPRSRKAANLGRDPRCTVCTERADEAVIVEGVASEVGDLAIIRRFLPVYEEKYNWKMDEANGPYFVVRPTVAFGFFEMGGEGDPNPTRWTFPRSG